MFTLVVSWCAIIMCASPQIEVYFVIILLHLFLVLLLVGCDQLC